MIWNYTSTSTSNTDTFGAQTVVISFIPIGPPPPDPRRVEVLLGRAKAIYRARAKECHPDAGGSVEAMQQLNAEYEEVKRRIRAGEIR